MSRYVIFLSVVALFGFSSCTKKTGTATACFTFSKPTPKVNDTLYLLNCSENYQKFEWINLNGFYPSGAIIDTIQRHQMAVVTAVGDYKVALRVGKYDWYTNDLVGYTEIVKTIYVNP